MENMDKSQQQQHYNYPLTPPHQGRSVLRDFGEAKSFDDRHKSSSGYGKSSHVPTTLDQSNNSPFVTVLPSNKSIHQASPTSGPIAIAKISPIKNQSFENEQSNNSRSEPASPRKPKNSEVEESFGDGMILTPVVSKVMGSAQRQSATVTHREVSSLNDDQSNRKTNARTSLSSLLNQYQTEPTSPRIEKLSPLPAENLPKGNPELPALSKSLSGDSVLKLASNFKPVPSPLTKTPRPAPQATAAPTRMAPANVTQSTKTSAIITREPIRPVEQQQQQPKKPLKAPVPASIIREDKSRENNPAVPRQRSLSEFPRPRPDFDEVNKRYFQPQPQQPIQNNYSAQSTPSITSVGNNGSMDSHDAPSHHSPSSPSNDQIMRTASGTSIFDRTKSLFISAQDLPIPPTSRNRQKPQSSLSKTQVMFPKQYEARMSPDSAAEKQRELEAYFKGQSSNNSGSPKTSKQDKSLQLRKSASHSKIMHRQRSLSDGEEDVDEIFESLFKSSGMRR